MIITPNLKAQIETDISVCENHTDRNGSERLYSELVARYIILDPAFKNGLSTCGKIGSIGTEFDYRPELRAIASKLRMYLIMGDVNPTSNEISAVNANKQKSKKVFIVHGHDNEAVQEMARTLEKDGFEPIVLHEQPDAGLTIIEKIERFTDVGYAVVLYTECDKGRDKNDPVDKEKYRARQNVVFEHGYLIGKLGRNSVSALIKGCVDTPGDINGVVYIDMDKNGAWKMQLAKNMQDVGLPVDMNVFCR